MDYVVLFMRRAVVIGLIAVGTVVAPVSADPQGRRFAVVFHVADDGVETDAAVRRWLDSANTLFGQHGICFDETDRLRLPDRYTELRSIRDRRKLREEMLPRVINVFVVNRIHDPNPSWATHKAARRVGRTPSGFISGAHIPAHGRRPGSYVILGVNAGRRSLTHELGHFFGAGHHGDPTNLMSYGATRDRFNGRQIRTFRARARRYARTGRVEVLSRDCSPESFQRVDLPSVTVAGR